MSNTTNTTLTNQALQSVIPELGSMDSTLIPSLPAIAKMAALKLFDFARDPGTVVGDIRDGLSTAREKLVEKAVAIIYAPSPEIKKPEPAQPKPRTGIPIGKIILALLSPILILFAAISLTIILLDQGPEEAKEKFKKMAEYLANKATIAAVQEANLLGQ
ncbi:MAG TPA: hypothetical protein VLF61_00455 [Rhabdochlamydiaceae bacterium]|nr:hypothetical protein [Rhabdochlamydiaceae bacterium]